MAPITSIGRSTEESAPTIGVALGSGAARGWAHIGVLHALHRHGVRPGVIAGSSIGALVGGGYAAGRLAEMESWVRAMDWWEIARYVLEPGSGGLVDGERLMRAYCEKVGSHRIEELPVRFGAVATELETGREVWFQEGELNATVRASISVPGLLAPVRMEGVWLVDGGVVDPVPVSLCRAMGADIVIAVNLNNRIVGKHTRYRRKRDAGPELLGRISRTLKETIGSDAPRFLERIRVARGTGESLRTLEVVASAMNVMQDRITRSRMAGDPPELVLTPRLEHIGLLEFDRADEAIREGAASVDRQADALQELLSSAVHD